ncbi:MAG: CopG family transcriptional regulator [Thermoleophilaceae bacterium]
MKKTSLYVDPDVDRALARRAATQGVTKAELVRGILAEAVDGERRAPVGEGVFEGPGDLAENVDLYLEQTGFGRR